MNSLQSRLDNVPFLLDVAETNIDGGKVRVDPFFRDLDQFTILLPLKDLSSVHNPYLLAMKNMITILFF